MILSVCEYIRLCLAIGDAYLDYPFGGDPAVLRHCGNKKIFAIATERDGAAYVNLKAAPDDVARYLRELPCAMPAWHMNKKHWFTIELSGELPDGEIEALTRRSFALVAPKPRRRSRGISDG